MLDNQGLFTKGLCVWAIHLRSADLISYEERELLENYIENNQPYNLHRLLYCDAYYWKVGSIKPRISWLKKHISIN